MNKTDWKSWKSQIEDFFKNDFNDFLARLGQTTASFLWSALLAFCLATTITEIWWPFKPVLFIASWILAWAILRLIWYFTVRNIELFAGVINATSLQSAFTFILNGILACFLLGRGLAEGSDLFSPIVRIVIGVTWLVLFPVEMFGAIAKKSRSSHHGDFSFGRVKHQIDG